ncbi:hypothetical protein J0S82_000361, partial [Galemys pyrenaicus]
WAINQNVHVQRQRINPEFFGIFLCKRPRIEDVVAMPISQHYSFHAIYRLHPALTNRLNKNQINH